MNSYKITYLDGKELKINDKVLIDGKKTAYVKNILIPTTRESLDYDCENGGFILVFENGDTQVWSYTDEDIILISHHENIEHT